MSKTYELNQILGYNIRSPDLPIGATVSYADYPIEIFDPQLALIGKIDKLPVLRSLRIQIEPVPDCISESDLDIGNTEHKWLIQLFNDNQYNNPQGANGSFRSKQPNLLATAGMYIHYSSALGTSEVVPMPFEMKYRGGIPLKPDITLRNESGVANAVAGSAIAEGALGHAKLFLEVDWKPVSQKDFEDYLKEYIYVQE